MNPVPDIPPEAPVGPSDVERLRIRADTLAERIGLADAPHRPSDDFEGCTE